MTRPFVQDRIVVRGAGDVASGAIRRLLAAGFEVIALEKPDPVCIRRYVCFAEAFFETGVSVEGITAVLVHSAEEAIACTENHRLPLLIDAEAQSLPVLSPMAVVDGRMLKQNIDTTLDLAPIVIGLGPGFTAGENCHAAIETIRGSDLGRILYTGSPQADTGVPAPVNGIGLKRVLRSPADGKLISHVQITDPVKASQILGEVGGVLVKSEIDGIVRGMIHDGLIVTAGQKIGDIDPRGIREYCYKISDKADAIGRGVVEAIAALKEKIAADKL